MLRVSIFKFSLWLADDIFERRAFAVKEVSRENRESILVASVRCRALERGKGLVILLLLCSLWTILF